MWRYMALPTAWYISVIFFSGSCPAGVAVKSNFDQWASNFDALNRLDDFHKIRVASEEDESNASADDADASGSDGVEEEVITITQMPASFALPTAPPLPVDQDAIASATTPVGPAAMEAALAKLPEVANVQPMSPAPTPDAPPVMLKEPVVSFSPTDTSDMAPSQDSKGQVGLVEVAATTKRSGSRAEVAAAAAARVEAASKAEAAAEEAANAARAGARASTERATAANAERDYFKGELAEAMQKNTELARKLSDSRTQFSATKGHSSGMSAKVAKLENRIKTANEEFWQRTNWLEKSVGAKLRGAQVEAEQWQNASKHTTEEVLKLQAIDRRSAFEISSLRKELQETKQQEASFVEMARNYSLEAEVKQNASIASERQQVVAADEMQKARQEVAMLRDVNSGLRSQHEADVRASAMQIQKEQDNGKADHRHMATLITSTSNLVRGLQTSASGAVEKNKKLGQDISAMRLQSTQFQQRAQQAEEQLAEEHAARQRDEEELARLRALQQGREVTTDSRQGLEEEVSELMAKNAALSDEVKQTQMSSRDSLAQAGQQTIQQQAQDASDHSGLLQQLQSERAARVQEARQDRSMIRRLRAGLLAARQASTPAPQEAEGDQDDESESSTAEGQVAPPVVAAIGVGVPTVDAAPNGVLADVEQLLH